MMKGTRKFSPLLLFILFVTTGKDVYAEPRCQYPDVSYKVVNDDYLWKVSRMYCAAGSPIADVATQAVVTSALHRANRSTLGENPDYLVPGMELCLPAAIPELSHVHRCSDFEPNHVNNRTTIPSNDIMPGERPSELRRAPTTPSSNAHQEQRAAVVTKTTKIPTSRNSRFGLLVDFGVAAGLSKPFAGGLYNPAPQLRIGLRRATPQWLVNSHVLVFGGEQSIWLNQINQNQRVLTVGADLEVLRRVLRSTVSIDAGVRVAAMALMREVTRVDLPIDYIDRQAGPMFSYGPALRTAYTFVSPGKAHAGFIELSAECIISHIIAQVNNTISNGIHLDAYGGLVYGFP